MKVLIDVEQMKKLLVIAQERGTVDSWIRLAVEWMEEASKQATSMRDRLVTSEAELSEVEAEAKSSAERLQEKVVCEVCDGTGRIYSHSPTSPAHGYPCSVCQDWYKGNR